MYASVSTDAARKKLFSAWVNRQSVSTGDDDSCDVDLTSGARRLRHRLPVDHSDSSDVAPKVRLRTPSPVPFASDSSDATPGRRRASSGT